VLCEAAWRAIRKDKDLKEYFERLYPRTGKKKAIVAVSRKLIGRIRSAFRQDRPYRLTLSPKLYLRIAGENYQKRFLRLFN